MREEFRSHLGSLGRTNPEDIATIIWWNVWGYILGFTAVWLYAAIRPRSGPGIATALRAGFAAWILSCVLMTITMANLRLFPFMPMAFLWSLFGDLIGTVAGAAVYKEEIA